MAGRWRSGGGAVGAARAAPSPGCAAGNAPVRGCVRRCCSPRLLNVLGLKLRPMGNDFGRGLLYLALIPALYRRGNNKILPLQICFASRPPNPQPGCWGSAVCGHKLRFAAVLLGEALASWVI